MLLTGLDIVAATNFEDFRGQAIAILCNQSSVDSNYRHILDLVKPTAVFGPEHGLFGHTQDNMIEWEGEPDPRLGAVVHSLYGQHREPTDPMLKGIERLIVDIPDVGARYYTFIWTMALCMKACERLHIPVTVLDRPNPINGVDQEGTLLRSGFESFVGLYPLPTRHGLTPAEVATYLHQTQFPNLQLDVVKMQGWDRQAYADDLGYAWTMPSPNMPTVDTAVVYPGGCLWEATTLSEGRGTTRPFEIIGAPYIASWQWTDALNALNLPGVIFRALPFEPTFNKHARALCGGTFIHVVDRRAFNSTLTTVAMMQEVVRLYDDQFQWKPGPYEYEEVLRPIDILAGNDWLAPAIEELTPLDEIEERFRAELVEFEESRTSALLYSSGRRPSS